MSPVGESDHYNPVTKKLALSESVYASDSIAVVGVATHERGMPPSTRGNGRVPHPAV